MSLSLDLFEGSGDCISFVSPAPAPAPKSPGNRRRGPRPSAEGLALSAYDRVISLAAGPDVNVAPARTGLTGLDSFFWVDGPAPISATARAPGLTVTAEARPIRYLWDFGDGNRTSTAHPGRPWTPRRPGNAPHLYETKGRYTVAAEVVWAARWRVNGGPWRDLGYFSTSGSTDYPVREMVAVLVRRR
ncbi:MAG: PKD domain-containing protein [Actinomycetota bacterium]